jgi:hypothetical protein
MTVPWPIPEELEPLPDLEFPRAEGEELEVPVEVECALAEAVTSWKAVAVWATVMEYYSRQSL